MASLQTATAGRILQRNPLTRVSGSAVRRWRDRVRRSSHRPVVPKTLARGGTNAVGRMLGLLGDEWNLLIVQQALLGRPSLQPLRHPPADLPNAVLTKPAADLGQRRPADEGLRTTPRSRSLWPMLLAIWEWGADLGYRARPATLPVMRRALRRSASPRCCDAKTAAAQSVPTISTSHRGPAAPRSDRPRARRRAAGTERRNPTLARRTISGYHERALEIAGRQRSWWRHSLEPMIH